MLGLGSDTEHSIEVIEEIGLFFLALWWIRHTAGGGSKKVFSNWYEV